MDQSLKGVVKQGCYKTEFVTMNCLAFKVAGNLQSATLFENALIHILVDRYLYTVTVTNTISALGEPSIFHTGTERQIRVMEHSVITDAEAREGQGF